MAIAYLDCSSGVAGNMFLGACIDAGVPVGELEGALAGLGLPGFGLDVETDSRHGIRGTRVGVRVDESHHHRRLSDVEEIVARGDFSEAVRDGSRNVFRLIAEAEGRVHGHPPDKVVFHEVGALDAVVDVVGTVWCFERLRIDRVWASRVQVGCGFVEAAHGRLPLPAPATANLLVGVPTWCGGVEAELVTPTGAALLRHLAGQFGPQPPMVVSNIAYGLGDRDLAEIPNALRIFLGEETEGLESDEIVLIETNIDDMSPEIVGHIFERSLALGGLDVFTTPIHMKKNRPALKISALVRPQDEAKMVRLFLDETTSFGVRTARMSRRILERRTETVDTPYGPVRVKVGGKGSAAKAIPEYEDCRARAEEAAVPVLRVYEAAAAGAAGLLLGEGG